MEKQSSFYFIPFDREKFKVKGKREKGKGEVAFRGAKSIFIEKVGANIGVLGVPSSPAAAGASPRRSLED